jgi:hypothetical protein
MAAQTFFCSDKNGHAFIEDRRTAKIRQILTLCGSNDRTDMNQQLVAAPCTRVEHVSAQPRRPCLSAPQLVKAALQTAYF